MPAHVKITPEMLAIKSIPMEAIHPDAFTSVNDAVGGTTKAEVINGEQVIKGRVITEGVSSPLAYRIPENMRAITIPMGEISGVAGFIEPGDRVDILVAFDDVTLNPTKVVYTQLQNIEVLEKGPYAATVEEKQVGVATSLTVLVTPAQAEVLAYANYSGTFHFSLRNPVDTTKVELQQFDSANFNTWRDR